MNRTSEKNIWTTPKMHVFAEPAGKGGLSAVEVTACNAARDNHAALTLKTTATYHKLSYMTGGGLDQMDSEVVHAPLSYLGFTFTVPVSNTLGCMGNHLQTGPVVGPS